jgi:hypothetical protein
MLSLIWRDVEVENVVQIVARNLAQRDRILRAHTDSMQNADERINDRFSE